MVCIKSFVESVASGRSVGCSYDGPDIHGVCSLPPTPGFLSLPPCRWNCISI